MMSFFRKKIAKQKLNKFYDSDKFFIETFKGKFILNTTTNHPLYTYLSEIKLYDRFLPNLVKNSNSGLIDIGANIGDTAVLTKSLSNAKIVCVEPDDFFLSTLNKNISENQLNDIEVFRYPISNNLTRVIINKNSLSSTGNIVEVSNDENSNTLETKTIENLIESLNLNLSDYQTLKIDTDGFDWDCLESLLDYYKFNPHNKFKWIFYEHQSYLNNLGPMDPNLKWRHNKYMDVLKNLRNYGYNMYYLFDNYGTFMFSTKEVNDIEMITNYTIRTQTENNRPSFYFCDIVLCNEKDSIIIEKTLIDYIKVNIKVIPNF